MVPLYSRQIVVDIDILRAAGDSLKVDLRSNACRKFLISILDICHRVVISEALIEEWERNRARFASRWLNQMFGHKKIETIEQIENMVIRKKIQKYCVDKNIRNIILKDFHLCETALKSDSIIASMDDSVRKHLSILSKQVHEIGDIIWVNPENPEEGTLTWLQNGAKYEKSRTLGYSGKS